MANEFSIQPAGDFSGPLSGLGDTLAGVIKQRKMQAAQQEIQTAMQQGDTNSLMKMSVKYPEFKQQLEKKVEQNTGLEAAQAKDLMMKAYTAPDDATIEQLHANEIHDANQRGIGTQAILQSLQRFHTDPEAWKKQNASTLAFTDPSGFKAISAPAKSEDPAEVQTMTFRAEQAGLVKGTPEYKEFFKNNGSGKSGNETATLQELAALRTMSPEDQATFWKLKNNTDIADAAIADQTKGLTGDDYLKALPPQYMNTVKAIAEGRETPSTLGLRGPERARIMGFVNKYKPDWEQGLAPARQAVQKDFSSGPTSKNITAINTSIHHTGTLLDMAEAMQNGDVKLINSLINRVKTETGNPNVNNFDLARTAVGDELMKAFRGAGASETEAEAWRQKFDTASSPEQIKGAAQTAVKLLHGRAEEVDNQWKRGMNTDESYPRLISPQAQEILDRIGGGSSKQEAPAAAIDHLRSHPELKEQFKAKYGYLPEGM